MQGTQVGSMLLCYRPEVHCQLGALPAAARAARDCASDIKWQQPAAAVAAAAVAVAAAAVAVAAAAAAAAAAG